MDIHPPSSGNTPRTGASRPGAAGGVRPERRSEGGTDAPRGAGDRIELSADAVALNQRVEIEPAPAGEISPERLLAIGQRLAAGHYDRPEVRDAILRGLIREFDAALG